MMDSLKQLAQIVGRELARRWLEEVRARTGAERVEQKKSLRSRMPTHRPWAPTRQRRVNRKTKPPTRQQVEPSACLPRFSSFCRMDTKACHRQVCFSNVAESCLPVQDSRSGLVNIHTFRCDRP